MKVYLVLRPDDVPACIATTRDKAVEAAIAELFADVHEVETNESLDGVQYREPMVRVRNGVVERPQ